MINLEPYPYVSVLVVSKTLTTLTDVAYKAARGFAYIEG